AIGAVGLAIWIGDHHLAVGSMLFLVFWVVGSALRDILDKTRNKGLLRGMRALPRSYWGMVMAHVGIAVCAVGVVGASLFDSQRDLRMAPGDSLELGGYNFVFKGSTHVDGSKWYSDQGILEVHRNGRRITHLRQEKRIHAVQNMPETEPGIHPGRPRDLFVAMGEPLDADNKAWAIRVHIKPFVRWIWGGGPFMTLGGL